MRASLKLFAIYLIFIDIFLIGTDHGCQFGINVVAAHTLNISKIILKFNRPKSYVLIFSLSFFFLCHDMYICNYLFIIISFVLSKINILIFKHFCNILQILIVRKELNCIEKYIYIYTNRYIAFCIFIKQGKEHET